MGIHRPLRSIQLSAAMIALIICILLLLSSCSILPKTFLTSHEVDSLFDEHFDDFQQLVQLCYNNPGFYEYYQKDDRFSLHKYSLKDIDSTERRQFFSDTEWSLFEKMFFAYGLYEISMHGSNHCIRFIWIIQDEEEEPTSLQYYYDVGNESDFFVMSIRDFNSVTDTAYENWYRAVETSSLDW